MTRSKVQKPWLCRHNHPMWRSPKTGSWVCNKCNELNLRHAGQEKTVCSNGHRRLGNTQCRVCKSYRQAPWLKELDKNGSGLCPQGHPVSHHDDSIMYTFGARPARRCRVCQDSSNAKGRSLAPLNRLTDTCTKGLHPWIPENIKTNSRGERQCRQCWLDASRNSRNRIALKRERKTKLRPEHVDWVVVERMLSRGTFPYIRRGKSVGPTDGERWVAYCTFVANAGGRHPEDLYGEPGYEAMQLYQFSAWRDIGTKYGWKELTLGEVRAMVHTFQYLRGRILQ